MSALSTSWVLQRLGGSIVCALQIGDEDVNFIKTSFAAIGLDLFSFTCRQEIDVVETRVSVSVA